jgi:succinate dehydrogenase hydrophobic anchor subunit
MALAEIPSPPLYGRRGSPHVRKMRASYVIIALCVLVVVVSAVVLNDPDTATRYAEMRRSVELSPGAKDVVMALIALAIGGYLGWHFLKRD